MADIKFGTDGWRARIAEDYTYHNVEVVTQALAEYVRSKSASGEIRMVVGYDRRFLSEQFAARTAEVLAGNGFTVDLLNCDTPTPLISFEVKRRGLDGGVVITASHNPPDFNGYKFKAPFGGAATPEITTEIETYIGKTAPRRMSMDEARASGRVTLIPPGDEYSKHVAARIDLEMLRAADALVISDPMHGTGGHWVESFLRGGKLRVQTIRGDRDPLFGGVLPEPMPQNLGALATAIRESGALIGLATDGDADRVGAMDERGEYINTHQILAIMLLHLARNKGLRGSVVRTFSQSVIVRRMAESMGFRLFEVPIGFKHIGAIMLDPANDFLCGGEESGGIGTSLHIPERDGVFNCLLLLEAVIQSGLKPSELVRAIWKEFGEFHFERRDLHVPIEKGRALVSRMASETPAEFAGHKVTRVETLDGSKLSFADDSWILFRQSGTEPVLRIYCEATTTEKMKAMMDKGEEMAVS
ncbi:MAG: phosphoglucomutase/phosphomannomutase family protein [Blastocatellia bacterium]